MSSKTNTHYSKCLNPALLSAWAASSAVQIADMVRPGEVPVLCYRGMSGTGSATALSLALYARGIEHGMIYVRKDGEMRGDDRCHGSPVERSMPALGMADTPILVFVDDFIGMGTTRRKVLIAAWQAGPSNMSEDCLVALSGYSNDEGHPVVRTENWQARYSREH